MAEATSLPRLPGDENDDVFRAIFLAYPDALLLVDGVGVIAMANESAATMLGYTVEELVGLPVDVLVPDQIRSRHASYRKAYGQAPTPRPMGRQTELAAKRKDGSQVVVEIALSPLQNHGHPFVVAAIRDIGAYPRVQQALQRARYSEHLAQLGRLAVDTRDLQVMLEHVPNLITTALQVEVAVVWLLDSKRLDFAVVSGVGLLAGERIGARVANTPDTPPGYMVSKGEPVVVSDYRNETRFVVPPLYLDSGLVSAVEVPLSDRGRVIGMLSVRSKEVDRFGVEELRFLESLSSLLATSLQRVQSEEALSHSQRLESVGQLTGGIAHDFNNLLTVIQGNLQVLEELPTLAQDEHAQQMLGAATRATRRGAELTGKLLAFSRRQVLQPVAIDIHSLLRSLAGMLLRTVDQRIRIHIDASPGLPSVLADPVQLESALLNIALNARDAMPDGGDLRFHIETCDALPLALRGEQGTTHHGSYVAISISDTGMGMADSVKERAFEPFFTTKEAGRGTGLGLSTVYGFIHQSRGEITIDSSLGSGTTVTIYLPAMRVAPAVAGEEGADESLPPGLRVMLVEDDVEVRNVVQAYLEGLQCEVVTAATARQALAIMGAEQRPFGLLLSDIALGSGMRGTRLADEAQQRFPGLAVLLMSGFPLDPSAADGGDQLHWEFLRKPYTRSELARAMARALSSH
jgi:PAS domain S-box-containing protein